MPRVIERFGVDTAGGVITFDDRPSSYDAADAIAGKRLDRRKNYCIINGEVCESVSFTTPCSGCNDGYGHDRGMGCHECGHTGKVRQSHWIPLWEAEAE